MEELDGLSSIFKNPENLLKLASTLQNTSFDDLLGKKDENHKESENEAGNDFLSSLPALGKLIGGNSGGGNDKNIRLLKALKPFLSEKRGEMIDKICSFAKLSSVFGSIGGK